MNFKDMLETLGQLSEAVEKTATGIKHKADPGGYGRKYDTDEEGEEKKKDAEPAAKRGRGRPKKGADDSGEVKKYDNAKAMQDFMIGNKPKKSKELDKLPSKKHSLKDWFEHVNENFLAEAEQVTMEPAKQSTQLIKQGTKTLGTVSNPALAATIKSAIGKGEMSLAGDAMKEEALDEKWAGDAEIKSTGQYAGKSVEELQSMLNKLKKSGPHSEGSPEFKKMRQIMFAIRAKKGWKGGVKEADIPPNDSLSSPLTLEAKEKTVKRDDKAEKAGKKVTKDLEYDMGHKGKDDKKAERAGKKVTKDIEYDEKKKKTMKEGMNHRLNAARLEGKAHGLKGHAYHGKAFEDMEEARMYHEGYKEGLDECYGMRPIQGIVDEMESGADIVDDMASYGAEEGGLAEDDMEEGNAFTAALARTPKGGKFTVGGKTFTDRTSYDSKIDEFAFESLDRELQKLLTEGEEQIDEGMSVSISKGQQGMPDTVSVTAQDGEADQLLGLIKTLGGGLFGGEENHSDYGAPDGAAQHGGIEVVDDHDGMLALMKKMSGGDDHSADYEDEEGHDHKDTCNECGMAMEAGHSCGSKEMVDEVESEDQMEFEVAEDNAPDSEEAEHTADEESEAQTDMALAKSDQQDKEYTMNEGGDGPEASEEDEEDRSPSGNETGEEVSESFNIQDLYKRLTFMEESTAEKDDKAEKAGKKVAKDIEYDEGHKGKDDDKAERAGKKVTKDIEYDDKKDKKLDEWANDAGKDGTDQAFHRDIEFMTKVIAGGLNKPKSTGQTTVPVIASQEDRQNSISDWKKLAGLK